MRRSTLVLAVLALFPASGSATAMADMRATSLGPEATQPIKIGVASTGPAADASISDEAARAPYILIFDHEGDLVEVMDNRDLPARQAGQQLGSALQEKGVTHYVAQRFGENLINALRAADIEWVEKTGPADEAVKQLLEELNKS